MYRRSAPLCISILFLLHTTHAQPDLLSRVATYGGAGLVSMSAETVCTDLGFETNYSNPQRNLVRHGSTYYHVFAAHEGNADVFLRTSTDGLTWSAPLQVNDDVPGDSAQTYPNLAVYEDGGSTHLVLSWADHRDPSWQLRTATSTDGGLSFGASVPVSTHADALYVTGNVAVDGAGKLYAAWSRSDGGCISGAWFSTSDDNGASWSPMTNIFGGGCYSDNAQVLAGGPDSVMVFVADDQFNHKNVIVLHSTDGGASFQQASVSTYTITQSITEFMGSAVDPSGRVHVVFTYGETMGTASSINYATSTDWGATWSVPVPVSDNPLFPVWGYHPGQLPSLAVNPTSGDVYIAWADPHAVSGDFEIYLTRSIDGGVNWDTDQVVNLLTAPTEQYYASIALEDLGGGNANVLVTWQDNRFVVGVPEVNGDASTWIHPNPVAELLQLDLPWRTKGPIRYSVLDVRGAVLLEGHWTDGGRQIVDVSRLASGSHVIRIVSAQQAVSIPWIKE